MESENAASSSVTPSVPHTTIVFNQYYWDLLKSVKSAAKAAKNAGDNNKVLKAIRANYQTFDRMSAEPKQDFYEEFGEFLAETYASSSLDDVSDVADSHFYKGITFQQVQRLVSPFIFHNYLTTFAIIRIADDKGLSESTLRDYLAAMKEVAKDAEVFNAALAKVDDERAKKLIEDLKGKVDSSDDINLKEIEQTSLGKMAMEIVHDLVGGPEGSNDFMQNMSNPDAMGKLISTVGSKIQRKLTSGELSQESLIDDAISLATKLPQLMPGMGNMGNLGGLGNLGNIGKMLANLQAASKGGSRTRSARGKVSTRRK